MRSSWWTTPPVMIVALWCSGNFPKHLLRDRENRGFSKANNQAIKVSTGTYVLLLNSDTVLENNAVGILTSSCRRSPGRPFVVRCC